MVKPQHLIFNTTRDKPIDMHMLLEGLSEVIELPPELQLILLGKQLTNEDHEQIVVRTSEPRSLFIVLLNVISYLVLWKEVFGKEKLTTEFKILDSTDFKIPGKNLFYTIAHVPTFDMMCFAWIEFLSTGFIGVIEPKHRYPFSHLVNLGFPDPEFEPHDFSTVTKAQVTARFQELVRCLP